MNLECEYEKQDAKVLLKWFWRTYVRRRTPWIIAALLFMAVQGSMLGVLSYLIGPMFDTVFLEKDEAMLVVLGAMVFAVFATRGVSGFLQRWVTSRVGEWIKYDLRLDMMRQVMLLDYPFFVSNEPGALINRVIQDTDNVKAVWATLVAPAVRDCIALASLIVVAVSIDWLWTVLAVAGIPLLVLPVWLMQRLTRRAAQSERRTAARLSALLDETFNGIHVIKLFGVKDVLLRQFRESSLQNRRDVVRTEVGMSGVPALVDLVAGLGFFAMLLFAGKEVIEEEKTLGQFMSFFTAVILLFDPLKRLGFVAANWARAKVSFQRVYSVFELTPDIVGPGPESQPPVEIGRSDLRCKDVSFDFGGEPVLDGFSAEFKEGRTTGIVGKNGAGKSTLINLLTRIFEARSGTITVGGRDIREMPVQDLRASFAVVPQVPGIFDMSIRENIMLGNPDAGADEFDRAASASLVLDFVNGPEFEGDLDSRCGPGGAMLSGGQRKRIAIARALIRRTRILLLDEMGAALDAEAESQIHKNIAEIYGDRTVIIVDQNLANLRSVDSIFVLDKGKLAEAGTHEELMGQGGLYRDLYESRPSEAA